MMKRRKRNILIVLAVAIIAAALAFQVEVTPIRAAAPASQPATTRATTTPSATPIAVQSFAAFTYFETSCATCHGEYGSAYGDAAIDELNDTELRTAIHNMADGPGNAPVDPPKLQVLFDYHKAMIAKAPFVVVTKKESADGKTTIEGEVSPDASVSVAGEKASVDGHAWKVTVPMAERYPLNVSLGERTLERTIDN
ncbi:MAG TPA: hypothetical protein VGN72_23115 [Tepidisphaeraceae bacterium]|jgi:mono/diheme cytochrome c family protein|nr:hypothetical protein [Tepidisphaeraceae bacterium]